MTIRLWAASGLVFGVLAGSAPAVLAQDEAVRRSWGEEARTEMARLAPMAGAWSVREFESDRAGGWTGGEAAYSVTIRYLLDNMALREDVPERPIKAWRLETTIQYDQNRDVFRLVALDDTWGNLDVFEGVIGPDDRLVVDNLRADTPFVNADGSRTHFRLTIEIIDSDRHSMLIDASNDAGESWQPFQRIERTRLGG
ncbi:DUF1579 family protein [uncultured Maricaulis sp.]|uniref:DUF1579 family protein n=1 Tax=uncultured Maricaulis sp. TaxID=174710 RepID=UPI0025D18715|nr:DUF1579 family protein [uncultured Maricaulis sp.]